MKYICFHVYIGEIVEVEDLVAALKNCEIQRAALDVTYPVPLPRDHPLLKCDHVIITPHYGAALYSARLKMTKKCVKSLKAVLIDNDVMPDQIN